VIAMLNLSKYYNHHCHTAEGSIGDSILKISEYVKKAKDYGLDKLTISDHGSLSAMYTFISACHKNNITPIIGMEAYEVEDVTLKDKEHRHANHLLLLAKNEIGLQNLFAIHNFAQIEGFYYKPKVDLNILKEYGNGIIACSACIAGRIPEAILNDDLDKAIELINGYKEVFDEFYLEIQPGKFEEQILVNDALIELGDYTNTPVVVTNDVHYLNPEDYIIHDYHVKLGRQKDKEDFNHDTLAYPDTCYWFMNKEDLLKNFTYTDILTREKLEEAIYNTSIIASECNIEFSDTIHMPEYKFVGNNTEEELLYKMCYEKLEKVIQDKPNPQDYIDRVERELKVIKDKKFCGYFLVVQDYINWSRKNNIAVGPGRGSCAGCLVAFLLGITRVDPIKYGLLFERFLDPNRDAIPDY
jgi:DNA polymerase-3 subunit alpha